MAEEKTTEAADLAEQDENQLEARVEQLQAALAKAEAKANENWEHFLRAKAEMENIRRRGEKDLSNAHKFGLEKFVNELLPVVDSFELGLAAISEGATDIAKVKEGSELTLKMLTNAVEKFGVSQLNPIGEKFNPDLHQAMTTQEKDGVEPNTVLAVVQKGYLLNERIVRPALVIISKAASAPPSQTKIDELA